LGDDRLAKTASATPEGWPLTASTSRRSVVVFDKDTKEAYILLGG
jgi:hypothetical protein